MTSTPSRRVALINDGSFYVGPPLARRLASHGHDIVIGDPHEGLVHELESLGARVVAVSGVRDLSDPTSSLRLADAAINAFGRIDAAAVSSGRVVTGRLLQSSIKDLDSVYQGCLVSPYNFLMAVLPHMVQQSSGQVLVISSASAARPTPGAPLYSSVRAAAAMLAKNAADEVARNNVQVNGVGTNFMDFPEFLRASGATDPEVRKKIEDQVPLRRLGTLEEFSSFCMPFLDGTSTFVTGQFVSFSGGWS
jgi:NAD(P)-dependent dehydrogenase (short-subunit alcohol dehydrogenase family)